MPNVYGVIPDGAGEPCVGTVVFRPTAVRGSSDGDSVVGASRIFLRLDGDGEFDIDLEPGNYYMDLRLQGAPTFSREIRVPDVDMANIKDILEDHLEVEG